jgi:hypothetical protein
MQQLYGSFVAFVTKKRTADLGRVTNTLASHQRKIPRVSQLRLRVVAREVAFFAPEGLGLLTDKDGQKGNMATKPNKSRNHSVTIRLSTAEYVAILKAAQIQCGPREPGDEVGPNEIRRFLRLAINATALAAIRAGAMPFDDVAVDIREATAQEERERLHLLLNPEKIDLQNFGVPPAPQPEYDPADFWKGFHRGN